MNNSRNVLVTTTSSLDGWKITNYVGVVTSHVVAGTGFFSDFSAGLTDFFGGRSETYRKQLESIDNEAIAELKSKAVKLGCNALIGLKIDHDEIGGKGKQMFMCTAQATAVQAIGLDSEREQAISVNSYVEVSSMHNLQKRKEILERINSVGTLWPWPQENDWKYLCEQRAIEFLPYVVSKLADPAGRAKSVFPDSFINDAKIFISLFPPEETQELLCQAVATSTNPRDLISIIYNLNLLDLRIVNFLLDSPDFVTAKKAVVLIKCNKSGYNHSDLKELVNIRKKIDSRFTQVAQFKITKSLFGKASEVWKCPSCNGTVEAISNVCKTCLTDYYGFTGPEEKKLDALSNLDKRISLLKELLGA